MLSPRRSVTSAISLSLVILVAAVARAQQPAAPAAPARGPGNTSWAPNGSEARARASAESKLVFYEFHAEGCGNCKRMDALLYPAFDFEALLVSMVPVKLAIESPEGKEIADRYAIHDTPAILITTPEGRLVFRVQGFRDAPDFYAHVQKDLRTYREFARRIESQDVGALSGEEAYATGRELYARMDPQAALPRLKRATVAPETRRGLRASAFEGLAAVQFDLGLSAEARRSIDQAIATTKSPDQRERAELFRAQIPLFENKPAEALVLYKKFEKDHPTSKYLDRVKSFIERLEHPTPKS